MASQALNAILNTIGPRTVIRYLNFAAGQGIGTSGVEEPIAAVGLEGVGELMEEQTDFTRENQSLRYGESLDIVESELADKLEDFQLVKDSDHADHTEGRKEDPSQSDNGSLSSSRLDTHYCYGAISDKIGEAVVCWLARWGVDILKFEQQTSQSGPDANLSPSMQRRRANTIPAHKSYMLDPHVDHDGLPGSSNASTATEVPLIWRPGGLSSAWVRRLLSSDILFVKGEKERFDLACEVVELRRQAGPDPDSESEWATLFSHGIYYANMVNTHADSRCKILTSPRRIWISS